MIDELIAGLKQLAKNRKIEDFNLDLEKLDTMEGRLELRQSLEPLQVNHLGIVKKLADIESDMILKRMLLKTSKMVVRVYMIEGFDLASRDIGGFSDPYLILKCGKKVYNDRKNYILDEPNPKFCKHWDFETTFPGCPMLFIEAMDYDDLFGDDLIGTTKVDLEDRYFLPEW
jgi:Ca2+-dependent lipid-binding protein